MTATGVVHGRFQIFHLDHLKYVLAAKEKCAHLVIGITNPDPMLTRTDPADPARSLPEANPLTYFERYTIIREVMFEQGVKPAQFSIVPFPINIPELYRFYLPLDSLFYLTIYDDWGRRKRQMLESLGLRVEVLWSRSLDKKGISAGKVRERIAKGLEWEHLVTPAAALVIKKLGIAGRIANP
jgi:nicotinamide-nucleotide adenylyltransferase